ncbi:MAG: GAF domain-containing protein [Phycisphaerales bacterium]|nr:GAF domain-containing protein [Phycisphaerales bacterium]
MTLPTRSSQTSASMQAVVDRLWEEYASAGLSWVGFYLDHPDQPDDCRLVLGPCRNGPACSPIGIHGACGQCLQSKQASIVRDVRTLGARYIACDPRDRSELILPCFSADGSVWGVLDADSHSIDHFTNDHLDQFALVLNEAGIATSLASP